MNETAEKLIRLLGEWHAGRKLSAKEELAFLKRKLICTPYLGTYGGIAGWVVCVEGTPPKGTLFFLDRGTSVFVSADGHKIKKVGENSAITEFYKTVLEQRQEPLTIELTKVEMELERI